MNSGTQTTEVGAFTDLLLIPNSCRSYNPIASILIFILIPIIFILMFILIHLVSIVIFSLILIALMLTLSWIWNTSVNQLT